MEAASPLARGLRCGYGQKDELSPPDFLCELGGAENEASKPKTYIHMYPQMLERHIDAPIS